MTIPIRYPSLPIHVERGLQLVEDSAWAWVRIPTVTHQWCSPATTLQVVKQVSNLISRQRDGEFHLAVVPRPFKPGGQRMLRLEGREAPGWRDYQSGIATHLGRSSLRHREVY